MRGLLLAALVACGGTKEKHDAGPPPPLPRPDCVVATISIRDVAEVARAVRFLAGPALPEAAARADARLWMGALADLPSDAAATLAAQGNAHLLLLDGAPGRIAWALPLANRRDPEGPPAADPRKMRRAGRHLVIAPDTTTLRAVAPYVERTLATREIDHAVSVVVDPAAAPKAAEALLGVVEAVAAELRDEARATRVQMGRAPEIGEPEAVAAWIEDLGRRGALAVGDAGLQASIDLSERSLAFHLGLDARPDTELARDLAETEPGPMPLAAHVPGDAVAAVLVRRGVAERRAATARTVELLQRLAGPRLAPGEAEALGAALARWDDASGTEGAAALLSSSPSPTLLVEGDAERPDDAAAALRAVVERIGQGHLALVGERLGLWPGTPARDRPAGHPATAPPQVAVAEHRVAVALGPSAADALARSGPSLADRREVAELVRGAGNHLVSLGALSPTALLGVLAPLGGQHLERIAASARTTASSERAAWTVTVDGRRLAIEARVPPPELRALASALRGD